jgi:hypothetical protein
MLRYSLDEQKSQCAPLSNPLSAVQPGVVTALNGRSLLAAVLTIPAVSFLKRV